MAELDVDGSYYRAWQERGGGNWSQLGLEEFRGAPYPGLGYGHTREYGGDFGESRWRGHGALDQGCHQYRLYAEGQEEAPRASARRGRKNHQHPDEHIQEDICAQLWFSTSLDSSDVSVEVKDGEVTLEGTVAERYMKHEIEHIAGSCSGVKDVHNNLRIAREGSQS